MATASTPTQLPAALSSYLAQHRVKLLASGGVLGAGAVVAGIVMYFQGNPEKAESTVATIAMSSFARSPTFALKKAIYESLPVKNTMLLLPPTQGH